MEPPDATNVKRVFLVSVPVLYADPSAAYGDPDESIKSCDVAARLSTETLKAPLPVAFPYFP